MTPRESARTHATRILIARNPRIIIMRDTFHRECYVWKHEYPMRRLNLDFRANGGFCRSAWIWFNFRVMRAWPVALEHRRFYSSLSVETIVTRSYKLKRDHRLSRLAAFIWFARQRRIFRTSLAKCAHEVARDVSPVTIERQQIWIVCLKENFSLALVLYLRLVTATRFRRARKTNQHCLSPSQ